MEYTQQDDATKKLVERICVRQGRLEGERSTWEDHWQECMDYIIPRKNDVNTVKTPGEKRNTQLYDTTAVMSSQLLAGALHGMLTSPTTRFFELMMNDPMLDENEEVKEWLQDSADRMYTVLNNSNFQTEVHEIYVDLCIGNACMYIGEHEEYVCHFSARPIKEIYIEENNLGYIDVVHRVFTWKPRQIIQEFGEKNIPTHVVDMYKKGDDTPLQVIHAVEPATDYENYGVGGEERVKKEKGVFSFRSCYVLKEKRMLLNKGGYREFPYAVPRWSKTTGEKYGRGPAMEMLPDIKMVNKMMEVVLRGAQKTVDPPLMMADGGVIGSPRLTPGGITIVRPFTEVPIRPLITDARIDFGYQAVEDVRKRIRAGFFIDQLQLSQNDRMTATEVSQRTTESLRLLSPILGRQHHEFLRPVIERVFGIMWRKGLLAPPPGIIRGRKVDVKYSSLVARAQKLTEGQTIAQAIGAIAPLIQLDPQTRDIIDTDAATRHILIDVYGLPQKILVKQNEVEEVRSQRAAKERAMQEQMQQVQAAESASKVMPGMAQMAQAAKEA